MSHTVEEDAVSRKSGVDVRSGLVCKVTVCAVDNFVSKDDSEGAGSHT